MANFIYIATSIDGYIARKDGNLDWLMEIPNPENSDYGFSLFLNRVDGIVMGRNTFETVERFNEWPYIKPVFVLSRSLKSVPEGYEDKVEILQGDLTNIVEGLAEKGFINLYIDGGKTIQSFLKLDLIDELIITRIPIILGGGIPLFAEMDLEIRFELADVDILNNHLVKNTYRRKKD